MCAVSNVGDYWRTNDYPKWQYLPDIGPYGGTIPQDHSAEIAALRKEMEELKKLLKAAKEYDKAVGEPDCEMDEKVALIKKMAKLVGVDMSEVFDAKEV
jgi:hypothetical protein